MFIQLGALGAVLRATSLLALIRDRHPQAHLTWLTDSPGEQLLKGLEIDRVVTTDLHQILSIEGLEFDLAYCLDKSEKIGGLLKRIKAHDLKGFRQARGGGIVPANSEASELWKIGLSDEKKFFENSKSEIQLSAEALGLWSGITPEYQIKLSDEELAVARNRNNMWAEGGKVLVGLNTGCSDKMPARKLAIGAHRELIRRLKQDPLIRVVLLGGQEDSQRNQVIGAGLDVVQSPTLLGLRDGLCSMAACDIVVSGDSLGLHMAIGLKKWTVAWFGPTCPQEIDLYGRGVKVLSKASCSPCWKRACEKSPMCYDLVEIDELVNGVKTGVEWKTSLSKQPSLETCFSRSR